MEDDFMKEINEGFASLRKDMAAGFKEAAASTSKIYGQLGVLTERVGNIREAQKSLEKEVGEMKKIEDDVKDNTKFRKLASKVFWIIATIVIGVLTYTAISIFVQNLASQG